MGDVHVEQRDNVLVATIDNPPHNLMDLEIHEQIAALARRADESPEVGAVVVTGAHARRFIAHFDVEVILAGAKETPKLSPEATRKSMKAVGAVMRVPGVGNVIDRTPVAGLASMERFREVNLAIERCSAVWIAAMNGDTGGGGLELALACDFRFMADGEFNIAQFEIFLGFPPGGGGTQRLARHLGHRAALQLCLDGRALSPREALDIGLVDRVIAPEQLVETAIAEAARLGRRPKQAIGAVKRSINIGGSLPMEAGLRLEAAEFVSAIATDESIAAQEAYLRRAEELGELPVGVLSEMERVVERGRFE